MRYLNFMIVCGAVTALICFAVLFWLAVHDDSAWTRFAQAHHCGEVTRYPESGVYAHAYLCDDGITYIKAD